MSDFRYDVAISFAGEQRRTADELAKCLRANNVAVFYDEFEDSDLWGKDLYAHLSDVYRKQARYCIIFASEAYARKTWTNLERKSAQARALEEKGNEYILPVRFDSTEIPGILPTMGYLDFSRYRVEGICNAFLKKLRGSQSGVLGTGSRDIVSTSSFTAIFVAEKDIFFFAPVLHSRFDREAANLVVVPSDPGDEHHLNALKGLTYPVLVAFKHDVALCKVKNVTFRTTAGVGQFELDLKILKTRFTPDMELGTSSTSKNQFAEMRTRRLLLNENPAETNSTDRPPVQVLNDAMQEMLIAGQGTITQVKASLFLDLYKHYRSEPRRFLEVAWIDTMLMLKTSACVADVERLVLGLKGSELNVDFRGHRDKEYTNQPPHEIEVQGNLKLE